MDEISLVIFSHTIAPWNDGTIKSPLIVFAANKIQVLQIRNRKKVSGKYSKIIGFPGQSPAALNF